MLFYTVKYLLRGWISSYVFFTTIKFFLKMHENTLNKSDIKQKLKILQARLQQYVNWELPDVQAGFRKGRGTRDQIANIHWVIKKERGFQKNIYFCFTDYAKAFVGITINCGKFFKRWEYQTILPVSWQTYMQVRK